MERYADVSLCCIEKKGGDTMFAKLIESQSGLIVLSGSCVRSGYEPSGAGYFCAYVGWFPESGICRIGALK